MKLKRESKIIKWAYFQVDAWDMPDRTNVCVLFWRCFLLTPLKIVFIAVFAVLLSPWIAWDKAKEKGWLDWLYREREWPTIKFPSLPADGLHRVAVQRVKDWKSGMCSIVEIE